MNSRVQVIKKLNKLRRRIKLTKTFTSIILQISINYVGRTRLKLSSPNPDGRTAGFVTLNTWGFDNTNFPGSTDSTPLHSASFKKLQNQKVSYNHNQCLYVLHSFTHSDTFYSIVIEVINAWYVAIFVCYGLHTTKSLWMKDLKESTLDKLSANQKHDLHVELLFIV